MLLFCGYSTDMKIATILFLSMFSLVACSSQPASEKPAPVMTKHAVSVPPDSQLFALIPATSDVWVYQQQQRALYYLSGAAIAAEPDDVVVFEDPIEFHVGNRFFFEEGLGISSEMLEKELAAIKGPGNVSPFIVTAPTQWLVEHRDQVRLPEGFDGWVVWLKPVGEKTMFTQKVEASVARVRHQPSE